MSHFLGGQVRRFPTAWLGTTYAAMRVVLVQRKPPVLEIEVGGLVILRGVELFPLPLEVMVVAPDGGVVVPAGFFLISVETVDPTHYLVDDHAMDAQRRLRPPR